MPPSSFASSSVPSLDEDLALAFQLSDLAAEVALDFFHRGVDTVWKEDDTPVSEADLEVDRRLLEALLVARPEDEVLSEESGTRGSSSRRWILDPIDGTFNFVENLPAWGTHVALEVDGELVLGVITRPVREQRWWGTRGNGAFRGSLGDAASSGVSVHVSAMDDVAKSRVGVWARLPGETLGRLEQETALVEATLDNILEVIEGDLEMVVGAPGKIWDHAPAVVIIGEAGGRFDDGQGGIRPDTGRGDYSNGLIDHALRGVLTG
jgi:histidinol-phosphatase